jgi:uncharacterized lipoprotein NlpE involved in copper resistance
MKARFIVILLVAVFSMVGCRAPSEKNPEAEEAALESAQNWLVLLDNGQYAESWVEAAEYFKAAIAQDAWEQSARAVREPLGKMVSRELKSKQYMTSVPGGPDGHYVILQFNTTFENKQSAIETVTPMLDKDDTWRVSGYYIN